MNKLLLLGYSHIAQKTIIPAIKNHPKVQLLAIASRTKYTQIPKEFIAFSGYKEAIDQTDCDTVYISSENCSHFEWIMYALKRGKNIICDKPVVLNTQQAKACIHQAGVNQIVFEATAYLYHNEHKLISKLLSQKHTLNKMIVQFGFPNLNKDNFRNKVDLGGGCIFDLGPYVVSAGEYYFNRRAKKVTCYCYLENNLPTTASITFEFGENQALQASIGFGLEYVNRLDLWGGDFQISLNRAFTIPSDLQNVITFKSKDQTKELAAPACDSFYEMFTFFNNLKIGEYQNYNKRLLDRLIMLDAINTALRTGQVYQIKYN